MELAGMDSFFSVISYGKKVIRDTSTSSYGLDPGTGYVCMSRLHCSFVFLIYPPLEVYIQLFVL